MDGFDLIIFDCDGVLVDSEIIAAEVESTLLTEAGYPISVEEMGERFAGMTWQNILLQVEREAAFRFRPRCSTSPRQLLDARLAPRRARSSTASSPLLSQLTLQRCICSNSTSHAARHDARQGRPQAPLRAAHLFRPRTSAPIASSRSRTSSCTAPSRWALAARACLVDRGFRSRHPWRARGRHARHRLHRRLAHLSLACRPADGCGRRNSDLADDRPAGSCVAALAGRA